MDPFGPSIVDCGGKSRFCSEFDLDSASCVLREVTIETRTERNVPKENCPSSDPRFSDCRLCSTLPVGYGGITVLPNPYSCCSKPMNGICRSSIKASKPIGGGFEYILRPIWNTRRWLEMKKSESTGRILVVDHSENGELRSRESFLNMQREREVFIMRSLGKESHALERLVLESFANQLWNAIVKRRHIVRKEIKSLALITVKTNSSPHVGKEKHFTSADGFLLCLFLSFFAFISWLSKRPSLPREFLYNNLLRSVK